MIALEIIMLTIFIYLGLQVLYIFIFSLAGKLARPRVVPPTGIFRKFAVMIPSYKEDSVILDSAKQALNQTYAKEYYDVVVIADSLKEATVQKLRELPIKVIEVSFEQSTKAKSLNKALEVLPEVYDYALILDADNVMAPDFLEKINAAFVRTCVPAIQGHRVAKNLNTNFAILDAISEEINNHIFRKGHRAVGLSSALIGSGMAFDYSTYKTVMGTIHAVGGFDRELGLKLLKEGVEVEYVEDALVYDEKVENAEVFQNQRKRWLSAQLNYFKKYFFRGLWDLITRGNVDFFDTVFQQFLLPRVLLIGATVMASLVAAAMQFGLLIWPGVGANMWMMLVFLNFSAMILAVPENHYNKKTLSAALSLPKAALLMFLTLFRLRGANKKFIHTPHSGTMDHKLNSEK